MKQTYQSHGRDTIKVKHLSIAVNSSHIEAHAVAPFLVRAKWTFEPSISGIGWDEPPSDEYFMFDTLYVMQDTFFATEEGVVVLIKPSVDLLTVLTQKQLGIIEEALRDGWEDESEQMLINASLEKSYA